MTDGQCEQCAMRAVVGASLLLDVSSQYRILPATPSSSHQFDFVEAALDVTTTWQLN